MILNADARAIPLADQSVQTVVTSPPYWGLRDYGNGGWSGGDPECEHAYGRFARGGLSEKQASSAGSNGDDLRRGCSCGATWRDAGIGMERSPQAWVSEMVAVFRELRRVLRDDGTAWLNVGDAYAGYWGDKTAAQEGRPSSADTNGWTNGFNMNAKPTFHEAFDGSGIKPKDLIGLPWRLAFALQADGWYLRSDIIWAKPNPMPESVRDRPTKAHEYVFLLSKKPRYYFDADAVRLPAAEASIGRWAQNVDAQDGSDRANGGAKTNGPMRAVGGPLRSSGQTGGAYNPPGQSPHSNARAQKNRSVRPGIDTNGGGQGTGVMDYPALTANIRSVWTIPTQPFSEAHFATFPKALVIPCIKAGSREGDLVLDPFAGSGTTCIVARKLARSYVGLELNPDYCQMARRRIDRETPPNLFDALAPSSSHAASDGPRSSGEPE